MILVQLALRSAVRNRRRSLISISAIALAVGLLIFARGTTNGLQSLFLGRVLDGQTGAIQVHAKGYKDEVGGGPLALVFDQKDIEQRLAATTFAPRIVFPAMIAVGETTLYTLVVAIDPAREYEVCTEKRREIGEGGPVMGPDQAVISPELRRQLGLSLGSEVTLVSQDREGVLNAVTARAGGFLADNPAFTTDKKLLFVPLALAQSLLRMDGVITEIAINADPREASTRAAELQTTLGDRYEVHAWQVFARFLVDEINNQEVGLSFVIFVFALLAMLGILNTTLMGVLSRTREIGAMMALGVKRRSIIVLVVLEASLLGVVGAALGAGFGVALVQVSHVIGFPLTAPGTVTADYIRPVIGAAYVSSATLAAILCASIAALYPAYRASRLSPVAALGAL